jgi:Tn3 transposase DDE domain
VSAGLEHCELIGKPADGHAATAELETELDDAIANLDEVLANAAEPGEVRLDDNGDLVMLRLSAEPVPDGGDALRDAIAHLLPRVTLGSMLVELHARVGLMNHFEHGGGVVTRHPDLQRDLIYVIVAEATNIGLTAIARTAGISYDTLAWTADCYLNEDNLQAANQALINYRHQLPITEAFEPGTLSSSDGQRFPVRSKSLTARHMSRYFARGQGISSYTHVSDQHTTFANRVIPATAHESHHDTHCSAMGRTAPRWCLSQTRPRLRLARRQQTVLHGLAP